MNSKIKLVLIGVGAVACTAMGYWVGVNNGVKFVSRQLVIELNSNEQKHEFDLVIDGRKLNSLLSKGCLAEALATIDNSIDMNTQLLADQFKGGLSPSVSKYISDREPDFLRTLDGFKSKYGNSWVEQECRR